MEEADADVGPKGVDVAERCILNAYDGTSIVKQLQNIGAASSQLLEPVACDGTQLIGPGVEPPCHGGIVL